MRLAIAAVLLAALGAGCFGLAQVNWGAVGRALNCPKGQHLAVISMVPVTINKTVIIEPIYACEES